jgi:hypothetical protein
MTVPDQIDHKLYNNECIIVQQGHQSGSSNGRCSAAPGGPSLGRVGAAECGGAWSFEVHAHSDPKKVGNGRVMSQFEISPR